MNSNFAKAVKEDIDWLVEVRFIAPLKATSWLFPIVVVSKKNGKLWISVDCRKPNQATRMDPFPLPFTNDVLDKVASHKMYSFKDSQSAYNMINVYPCKCHNTTFITIYGLLWHLAWLMHLQTISGSSWGPFNTISTSSCKPLWTIFASIATSSPISTSSPSPLTKVKSMVSAWTKRNAYSLCYPLSCFQGCQISWSKENWGCSTYEATKNPSWYSGFQWTCKV